MNRPIIFIAHSLGGIVLKSVSPSIRYSARLKYLLTASAS